MSNSPFQMAPTDVSEINPEAIAGETNERIKNIIESAPIVLFMKGNSDFPRCGFSANTIAILKHYGASFKTFNILTDEAIRQGIKEYSNWPTFPQLYVKGRLVGGNDIISEMHEDGELESLLKD